MPTTCAVLGCKNTYIKNKDVSFHKIPSRKDAASKNLREQWIRCCKRVASWNPIVTHICSDHFSDDDFERDMRNELLGNICIFCSNVIIFALLLLGLPPRKILKKGVVPTLNLPNWTEDDGITDRKQRYLKKKSGRRKQIKEKVKRFLPDPASASEPFIKVEPITECIWNEPEELEKSIHEKYEKLLESYNKLNQEVVLMKNKIHQQEQELKYYRKHSGKNYSAADEEVIVLLHENLSTNQIVILPNKRKTG